LQYFYWNALFTKISAGEKQEKNAYLIKVRLGMMS